MFNLEIKLNKLKKDKEKLREDIAEVEADTTLTDKEKNTKLTILRFHAQDTTNAIVAIENTIKTTVGLKKHAEEQAEFSKLRREEEAKHIIPKIYQGQVSELKRLQIMQEQEHKEIRDRAKRLKTTVNEEWLKEQRKILNTKILNELSFLATTKERKTELTNIFNLRF